MPTSPFSCVLIGADTLLMECGRVLSDRGHEIVAVVSDAPRIRAWAAESNLRSFSVSGDYASELRGTPFDYLFSITHLAILPEDVLALPARGAVNFHDGVLPRYAGLNTPVWALLRGEEQYGITWHRITTGIDRGDVLERRSFEIAPGETALSLNTRCFEAALESFPDLLARLEAGDETAETQDFSSRKYFGRYDRPAAECAIDWRESAEDIARLVRALDFGTYLNPIGCPKIAANRHGALVRSAEVRAEATSAAPGTVVSVDDDALVVAAGDGVIALTALSTPDGEERTVAEFCEAAELVAGRALDDLAPALAERVGATRVARGETVWTQRLAELDGYELPYADSSADLGAPPETFGEIEIDVPAEFRALEGGGDAESVVAGIAAYFARLADRKRIEIAYRDAEIDRVTQGLDAWFGTRVPFVLEIDDAEAFSVALGAVRAELDAVRKRGPFLRDVLARYPELQSREDLRAGRLLPVAIEIGDRADDRTPAPGTQLRARVSEDGARIRLDFDPRALSPVHVGSIATQLASFFAGVSADADRPCSRTPILSDDDLRRILVEWNDTEREFPRDALVHTLFEAQVERTPDAPALVFENTTLSYRELNARANRVARALLARGVGPDRLVGVCIERGIDLVVAIYGIHKAGGAYVPLDPDYPADRLAMMVDDAKPEVVLTSSRSAYAVPEAAGTVICLDGDRAAIDAQSDENPRVEVSPAHLAYVIYTSGSTGKPKGVMVEHRNVVNFFAGMDEVIPHESGDSWLAVTSLSFDISVLELFWTLTRGLRVVLYSDRARGSTSTASSAEEKHAATPVDFSLFYFSSNEEESGSNKYELLLEGAKFGDAHGFTAVWTPERHFHAFGGLYPNPAVTGAAVAAVTKNIGIRAGSVVLPLHHPVRVAEAWSIVDNLCGGRVGISVASGWQPNDFLLRPESYKDAKGVMFRDVEVVKRLWRGEKVAFPGATGEDVEVRTLPRPVQKELPIWVTTAGNPETYRMAGETGANVLTHLLGQSVEDLAPKIELYRKARADAGFDPDEGVVSLMLHTYVSDDASEVRDLVREPLKHYLGTSLNLLKQYASSFPAFTDPTGAGKDADDVFKNLSEEEQDAILEHAFERYYETSGLFGTPESCVAMVDTLKGIGVDDIACLIDFGVPTPKVLASLPHLNRLRQRANAHASDSARATNESVETDQSFAAQVGRHEITHLQCTPSMANMLAVGAETRDALRAVRQFMIGGEAFPPPLARELDGLVTGTVTNMYGPTETTIWSSTQVVEGAPDTIPIGRPIANTSIYILDRHHQPVPPGVPGELWIGGDGVVRGYLNRDELTAERFVHDPFRESGARMYRTGDLARFRDDGVIEFLGRIDHQVKVRGYRIELGEIEAALRRHEGIRECVVVAREDRPGDQQLVAYFTSTGDGVDTDALRGTLRETLPDFMVPGHFVALAALPLTPNGKIDRRALPAPESVEPAAAREYAPPTNDTEEVIATVWRETLGLSRVGVNDNFFDSGGHSLLVVRVHRSLSEKIDQPVNLTDLYRFPTIRSLAGYLTEAGDELVKRGTDRAAKRRDALQGRRRRAEARRKSRVD